MINETLLNRYRIEAEIGKGGMGIVYQAHDVLLDRVVAIKFLSSSEIEETGKERLLQEARTVAKLNHPNIVSVFDAGESNGVPFLVMELVYGETLRSYRRAHLLETLNITRDICNALEHAHTKGIIHRDLKPENIIISASQTVKLMDFGLARTANQKHLTKEGLVFGTFAYLAPELIEGGAASIQSDLYALGVILYELLTGTLPFTGTISEIISQHLYAKVKPPSEINPNVPAWADDLVAGLLQKRPEERPASARDVTGVIENQSKPPEITFPYKVEFKTRNNLPSQLTSFVGREKEIEQIHNAVRSNRLVTLTGVGGTGKTRLALQVAAKLLNDFSDGVWFVELAPVTDREKVPQSVALALQLREIGEKTTREAVTEFLSAQENLLILDNCEHLIDICAEFSNHLLQHCPELKIITTSREPLGIVGEIIWSVPSLSFPTHETDFTEELWDSFEAIKLFIERAQAVQPAFKKTGTNYKTISQICKRLDGIPLALELAAARVRNMNIEQVASRLDDRFRLLTGGSRTALPRQQTLNALVDWSYNLLSDIEKLLFQRLAVFIGLFTLEAAEKICARGRINEVDVFDTLQRLVDKSLVNIEERDGDTYYRLLETIRQYGQDKLFSSTEVNDLVKQHNKYFFELTGFAEKELRGPNQIKWLNHLNAMFDNIRAALEASIETNQTKAALELALNLEWFWFIRGRQREASDWFQRVLSMPDVDFHPEVTSGLLSQMAHHTWIQLGSKKALPFANQALDMARFHKHKHNTAKALCVLGVILANDGNFTESHPALDESKKLFEEIGDRWNFARTYMAMGLLYSRQENSVDALSIFKQALELFREIGDGYFIASASRWVGHLTVELGEVNDGLKLLNESIIAAQKLKSTFEVFASIWSMAIIAQHLKQPARSVRLFLASKKMGESLGVWTEEDETRLAGFLNGCLPLMDEKTFKMVEEQGRALTMEQAIEYALGGERYEQV